MWMGWMIVVLLVLMSVYVVLIYDVIVCGGMIYDGIGGIFYCGDVVIKGDRIVVIGKVCGMVKWVVDVWSFVVVFGFINMFSWVNELLIVDGCGMSDIK